MSKLRYENILVAIFSLLSIALINEYVFVEAHYYWTSILGIVVAITGSVIWWLGKLTLGHNYSYHSKKPKNLVMKGIYKKIRHPIYVGLALTIISWTLLTTSIILLFATFITIIILIIRVSIEERAITDKFGEKYDNYRKKTWF